jgi:predicted small integral membrane protein
MAKREGSDMMTIGDRVFLSMAVMIIVGLLWLRFFSQESIWGALLVSLVIIFFIFRYGQE